MTRATAPFEVGIALEYVETSIPAGVTISEYRLGRPRRPSRWERLKHLARVQIGYTG
jgi:hypothetical protein